MHHMNLSPIVEQKMHGMLKDVRTLIQNMLQVLNDIYKKNGVRYSVMGFEISLYRMLCPIEISTLINPLQVQLMLQKGTFLNKTKYSFQKKYKIEQKLNQFFSNSSTKQESKEQQYVYEKKNIQLNEFNNESYLHQENDYVEKKIRNHRPSKGLQGEINKAIANEYRYGGKITKRIIMERARQIAKGSFKACPRWCDLYLKRNPQIKVLVSSSNRFRYHNSQNLRNYQPNIQLIKPNQNLNYDTESQAQQNLQSGSSNDNYENQDQNNQNESCEIQNVQAQKRDMKVVQSQQN